MGIGARAGPHCEMLRHHRATAALEVDAVTITFLTAIAIVAEVVVLHMIQVKDRMDRPIHLQSKQERARTVVVAREIAMVAIAVEVLSGYHILPIHSLFEKN